MGLNVSEQECNGGKKYGQKGTLCGPNISKGLPATIHTLVGVEVEVCMLCQFCMI
jgi:hypothetical protein